MPMKYKPIRKAETNSVKNETDTLATNAVDTLGSGMDICARLLGAVPPNALPSDVALGAELLIATLVADNALPSQAVKVLFGTFDHFVSLMKNMINDMDEECDEDDERRLPFVLKGSVRLTNQQGRDRIVIHFDEEAEYIEAVSVKDFVRPYPDATVVTCKKTGSETLIAVCFGSDQCADSVEIFGDEWNSMFVGLKLISLESTEREITFEYCECIEND